jgi:protein-S-isoprenylcysteine O-methyltransferase Ste14
MDEWRVAAVSAAWHRASRHARADILRGVTGSASEERQIARTVAYVAGGTALFALTHSILATQWMKDRVEALFGRRVRDGLYRFVYNNVTYASLAVMVLAFSRLPDRVVYRVPRPWSLFMRVGQGIGVWLIADTNLRMGIGRFTGLSGLLEYLSGSEPHREPPAQGPRLEDAASGSTRGAFSVSRHPNNLGPTLIVCLQPTMGVRLLTFALVGGLYSFFGSMLEERRVRAAYPGKYDVYRATTPFFFPFPRKQP